jgi:hypothetical protein
MKFVLLFPFLAGIFGLANCQDTSIFVGQWQYIDSKKIYHEILIEDSVGYIYGDSSDPAALKVTLYNNIINWEKLGAWTLLKIENDQLFLDTPTGKFKLYRLPEDEDNIKSFYIWCNDPERTGNGYSIFLKYLNKRKNQLTEK